MRVLLIAALFLLSSTTTTTLFISGRVLISVFHIPAVFDSHLIDIIWIDSPLDSVCLPHFQLKSLETERIVASP